MTQDDSREKQIIKLCQLIKVDSRCLHDAEDKKGNMFEVKTLTSPYKGISTARQVHVKKINKWRQRYWLFAKGKKNTKGMKIEDLYIHHPNSLEPFFMKCEERINKAIRACSCLIKAAKKINMPIREIKEVLRIIEIGARLDNPTISQKLMKSGFRLSTKNSKTLKKEMNFFVAKYPLRKTNVK